VNAIIISLPMIDTTIPGMTMWHIPTILSAIISTIMIIIVWRFGVTFSPMVADHYPKFPEIRIVMTNVIYLICLVIAYGAFRGLLGQFLYNFTWIYDLAFLLVGLYIVYILATLLMKNSDKLSQIIVHDVSEATGGKKICKKCGTENSLTNKFCDKCGSRLD
jgi:ribosomal protein L40E